MFLFVGGSRFSIRLWHRRKRRLSQQDSEEFHRVMWGGAGEMGSMVIKDMKTRTGEQRHSRCGDRRR